MAYFLVLSTVCLRGYTFMPDVKDMPACRVIPGKSRGFKKWVYGILWLKHVYVSVVKRSLSQKKIRKNIVTQKNVKS